jgi:transcriptional regulator with XRE-family HTH domain
MTPKELAQKTGITIRWARCILKGKRPSAELAERLEQATGVFAHVWLFPSKYKNELLQK